MRSKGIALKDEAIVKIESDLALKNMELAALKKDYQDLVDAEPPTTPEIESMPIVINLRAQIGKLNEMFSLATGTITLQNREFDELKGKVSLLEDVCKEWKDAYERKRALRIQAEELLGFAERRFNASKTWTRVALGVTAGALVYGLAK